MFGNSKMVQFGKPYHLNEKSFVNIADTVVLEHFRLCLQQKASSTVGLEIRDE